MNKPFHTILLTSAALIASGSAYAQDQATAADVPQDEIVVTAVARGQNRLNTSVTVSSLNSDDIAKAAPRSVAEIFRNLPGIRSESSGGEGNANISVRGLPVASGGAKFLQLQEDGLPVLEFGDITFGNADIFLRSDFNIGRVESVRGGSASTFASNAPGGVINLISKTGEQEGGAIQATAGIDYRDYRIDFDYGGRISDTLRYHVGGFYRQGEGPRKAGYDANKGGQIKANITKEFAGGYIRLYGKYLNDRAIGYLPNPVLVSGSNSNPDYQDLPGFSITGDTLHSRYFRDNVTLDGNNNLTKRDIRDGQHPLVYAVGLESQFDLGDGWNVTERFRYSDISGGFTSPFPSNVDTGSAIATALGGAGSTLTYANGPKAGQAFDGRNYLAQIVLFDVKLNSLNNITNDIRVSRDFDTGVGKLTATAGFYKSRQTIDTDWLWTSHLLEVTGGGNAALVDLRKAAGQLQTLGGTYGYGATFFGNCCRRSYDVHYNTNAPFASLSLAADALTIDGSLRYDMGSAKGSIGGADLGGGRIGVISRDMNGDGVISVPETKVGVIPAARAPVDYDYHYLSYSVGVNYRLDDSAALFARYSRGARANADRLLFGPAVSITTGNLTDTGAAIDYVRQLEGGVKYRSGGLTLNATAFHARTEEQNFEATTQTFFNRNYRASGLELEGSYRIGGFSLTAGGTYTDAKIASDVLNPAVVGNRPRRQAKFIYQVTPQYDAGIVSFGANVVGTSSSFTQDTNQLKLPGFTQVNAFVTIKPMDRIQLSVNANNLFDVKGFTEAEDAAIPANGIVRARSINGRTISASVRYNF